MKLFNFSKDGMYYKIIIFGIKITLKRKDKLSPYRISDKDFDAITIKLDNEFDRIWSKIKNGEHFVLMRAADGEYAFMTGKKINGVDGWLSTDSISKLGYDLLETLKLDGKNIIYGISCPCCDKEAYYWYISRLNKNMDVTFSNIFVNSNYEKFSKKFLELRKKTVLIANHSANGKKIGNLVIEKFYPVRNDPVDFWEKEGQFLINKIIADVGNKNDLFYVVSAGPMSEPIIAALHKNNPNNTYIDFGSSIDIFIHEKPTREYHHGGSISEKNCWMYDRDRVSFDVSVVLTLYKRGEYLKQQLDAILNQTLKPKEIILFQDETNPISNLEISDDIKNSIDIHIKPNKNIGVWGRFSAALLSTSEYVCIFDDDSIPGSRWLENCHSSMMICEGLYGTIGISKIDKKSYHFKSREGWDSNNDNIVEVAYVGHSWFLKRDWLGALWIDSLDFYKLKTAAEDMYLSYQLKKYFNINTYVPPHPKNNTSFFGSIPDKAVKIGCDSNALAFTPGEYEKRISAIKIMINSGGFKKFL